MATKKMDLSGYRDVDVKSITLKSVNGDDTLAAAARCVPPDGGKLDPNLFGFLLRQQMVAQAIVEVDGKAVSPPYLESTRWSNRTRDFVSKIYDYLNGTSDDEDVDFRKELYGESAPKSSKQASNAA